MAKFFITLMVFFVIIANIIGIMSYKKKKNLYYSAFTILLLAVLFSAIGGILAVFIIRDAFAIFYGMQIGQILLINSVIVFVIAILSTVVKKYSNRSL